MITGFIYNQCIYHFSFSMSNSHTACVLQTKRYYSLKFFITVFNLMLTYFTAIHITYCRENNRWRQRTKEGCTVGDRRHSLKNVNTKPCEQLDCCLSYELERKITSYSHFLFVRTLLYKLAFMLCC